MEGEKSEIGRENTTKDLRWDEGGVVGTTRTCERKDLLVVGKGSEYIFK